MERTFFTGIDLHKRSSHLATVDAAGEIVAERNLRNDSERLLAYFAALEGRHLAVVESTGGWYWLEDVLTEVGVILTLAHAKYLKAISYAKVKTDRVDARTLAQLLRVDLIPAAHKISRERREQRDIMRTRLRLVQRATACRNSQARLLEKYNVQSRQELVASVRLQFDAHQACLAGLEAQIHLLERSLYEVLTTEEKVQHLLWIPGIGRILALTILFEVDDIARFQDVKRFFSYCRLVPGSNDSGDRHRHKRSKDGNRYLKLAFSHAAVRAIQNYPEVRTFYRALLRKKKKPVARAIVAKELARIVYTVLQSGQPYDQRFRGQELSRPKSQTWPRLAPHRPAR